MPSSGGIQTTPACRLCFTRQLLHPAMKSLLAPYRYGSRAALEVDDFDGKSGFLELAELLGQDGRQITKATAAADSERDFGLRERDTARQQERDERGNKPPEHCGHDILPVLLQAFAQAISPVTISQRKVSA